MSGYTLLHSSLKVLAITMSLKISHHRRVWQAGWTCCYHRHAERRCCNGRPSALVLASENRCRCLSIPYSYRVRLFSFKARRGTNYEICSAETLDLRLTDISAFPVKPEHVLDIRLDGGPVPEGNVGGGTGMISFSFKVLIFSQTSCAAYIYLGWDRHFLASAASGSWRKAIYPWCHRTGKSWPCSKFNNQGCPRG